ncbi:putative ankyrin repeat-containing domain-containing protein [Medicago truncatula]|uniref:Putative ankyrin repeat-containing domain-containing protein n=1 Tax=Medicago truncatula TaxID=3880 RepID=A0A396H2T1_MEDTR|nr:putative ankyrin repeat-containing domain-containing protein [Medicago truncatula]
MCQVLLVNESPGQSVIRGKSVESCKHKLFVCLQTGQRVSIWKCLIRNVSENVLYDDDVERLKSLTVEPRNNTRLRIVLLASGGHFAGCVFDGDTLVAHKTFHRYVARAKAGKKQSSKDAFGKTVHSAGDSLRLHMEHSLMKEVRELLTAWRPYFDASVCIFMHAPSSSRQLLFDREKPCFTNSQCVRNIAMIVRRPTLREAKRVYGQLTLVSYEADEKEIFPSNKQDVVPTLIDTPPASKVDMARLDINAKAEAFSSNKNDEHLASSKVKIESEFTINSTPLHQAAQSGDAVKVMELLEQGMDPCIKDDRGRTPYMLAPRKQIKKTFRRFMASNLDKWDWKAAQVFCPLTKEMEKYQAAMKAERRAKAKELKKIREAEEIKAQAEAAEKQAIAPTSIFWWWPGSPTSATGQSQPKSGAKLSKEEEIKRAQDAEREKRAAATERRMAALKFPANSTTTSANRLSDANECGLVGNTTSFSCCNSSLAGRMSPLNDAEFKTYLAKAREKRATVLQSGAAEAKLDVSGVTICKLKRKGGGNSEEGSPSLSDTEPIAAPPLNNDSAACDSKVVLPLPRKKIKKEKTCVPMEETEKASLWDRCFDGMGFVDSNLSFTKMCRR